MFQKLLPWVLVFFSFNAIGDQRAPCPSCHGGRNCSDCRIPVTVSVTPNVRACAQFSVSGSQTARLSDGSELWLGSCGNPDWNVNFVSTILVRPDDIITIEAKPQSWQAAATDMISEMRFRGWSTKKSCPCQMGDGSSQNGFSCKIVAKPEMRSIDCTLTYESPPAPQLAGMGLR